MSAETNEYQVMKHFLLWGGVVTHTSSSKYESRGSVKCPNTFFLIKMQQVLDLTRPEVDKYKGVTLYICIYISIYVKKNI